MMPHSSMGIRVHNWKSGYWRDMRHAKALNKIHQEALNENRRRGAEREIELRREEK